MQSYCFKPKGMSLPHIGTSCITTKVPDVQANGFYGSKGISGYIPEGYTLLEQRFMKAVRKAGKEVSDVDKSKSGVELREWEKYRWTYHAKGTFSFDPYQPIFWAQWNIFRNRHLAPPHPIFSSSTHSLWFYEPQLSFVQP